MSQAIGNAGTPISRQGLDQRFDAKAAAFMKAMVDESLKVVVRGTAVDQGLLARFTAVELTDSSVITLPNALQTLWRGSGGFGDTNNFGFQILRVYSSCLRVCLNPLSTGCCG